MGRGGFVSSSCSLIRMGLLLLGGALGWRQEVGLGGAVPQSAAAAPSSTAALEAGESSWLCFPAVRRVLSVAVAPSTELV